MRDTRKHHAGEISDREIFDKFKNDLKSLMSKNGYELKYNFAHHLAIIYDGGLLEIFEYDRPKNPRIENGILEFDWDLVGECRIIRIKLV